MWQLLVVCPSQEPVESGSGKQSKQLCSVNKLPNLHPERGLDTGFYAIDLTRSWRKQEQMTVKQALKRPEVLAPAGTLEKLKTAIHYGADAVYIGGMPMSSESRETLPMKKWRKGWLLPKPTTQSLCSSQHGDPRGAIKKVQEFFRDASISAVIVLIPL